MSKKIAIPKWITASAILRFTNWLRYLPDTAAPLLRRWPTLVEGVDWLVVRSAIFVLVTPFYGDRGGAGAW